MWEVVVAATVVVVVALEIVVLGRVVGTIVGRIVGVVVGATVVATDDVVVVGGTLVVVAAAVDGGGTVEATTLEVVDEEELVVVVTGLTGDFDLCVSATTMSTRRTTMIAQARACNAPGRSRNRSHGPSGPPGPTGPPGGGGRRGGTGPPAMTWVGGVGEATGWATVGARSGGYQRPSASCRQPGPIGESDMMVSRPATARPATAAAPDQEAMRMVPRMVSWLFRSREDGRITIVQPPNLALGLFLAATIAGWILNPAGTVGTAVRLVATGALLVWALDELVRGVNPWRRVLGGGMLAWQAVHVIWG